MTVRAGILLVGSLLWGTDGSRRAWRELRLSIPDAIAVDVPIRYGRRSATRGNTFTMTISSDGPMGRALVAPCRIALSKPSALVAEAEALWKAEQSSAPPRAIGAPWGCVGALFRDQETTSELAGTWIDHFRGIAQVPTSPVDSDGLLSISWPAETKLDVILATATKAEDTVPSAARVADLWIDQDEGHERYFFENVKHGIRTADDEAIWQRIERAMPGWIQSVVYDEAIALLRTHAAPNA
jgi:hypothetical protein